MEKVTKTRRPSTSPEEKEGRCIAKAYERAEEQLERGTASSQIIAHFLKQGSPSEKLKREQLQKQNDLLDAKIKAYNSMSDSAEAMNEVLKAFKSYSGQTIEDEEFDEEDWDDE